MAPYGPLAGSPRALDVGHGVRLGEIPQKGRQERVHLVAGHAALLEPRVEQARGPQAADHRGVEGRVVVGVDRVERDPDQRRLDDGANREGGIQVDRVEIRDPVPEGDVGRCRLLGLDRDDPADRVRHRQRLPLDEELAAKGRPVQLTGSEGHARSVPSGAIRRGGGTFWPGGAIRAAVAGGVGAVMAVAAFFLRIPILSGVAMVVGAFLFRGAIYTFIQAGDGEAPLRLDG